MELGENILGHHHFGHDLSPAERAKVTEAVTAAEKTTSGEIVVVVAHASDEYIHVPIHIATGVAFAVPVLFWLYAKLEPWGGSFELRWIFHTQFLAFIVTALLLNLPGLRRALTPWRLMRKYAHRNAAAQFLATNIAATKSRTGVLLFVSLWERYVEVIGDEAISAKLQQSDWQRIIDEMVPQLRAKQTSAALIIGVQHCGVLLARHFPASHRPANELPDRMIVLD